MEKRIRERIKKMRQRMTKKVIPLETQQQRVVEIIQQNLILENPMEILKLNQEI